MMDNNKLEKSRQRFVLVGMQLRKEFNEVEKGELAKSLCIRHYKKSEKGIIQELQTIKNRHFNGRGRPIIFKQMPLLSVLQMYFTEQEKELLIFTYLRTLCNDDAEKMSHFLNETKKNYKVHIAHYH